MQLTELLDTDLLNDHLNAKNVKMQVHPTEPLRIFNYTAQCQYARAWDDVTRQCRGLIVDWDDLVVARPFPKFFNYGEHEEDSLDLDVKCVVTDKLDGSLGILYPCENGDFGIATRGSFTSEQAIRGTEMLQEWVFSKTRVGWRPLPVLTYLFEIIYPENRIVVNYEGISALVALGAIETGSGLHWSAKHLGWPGPRIEPAPAFSLREALALPPRANAEGLVIRYWDGTMLKLKQEDYVELHRLVTGLNEKTIWAMLSEGQSVNQINERLPEEFHQFVINTAVALIESYDVTGATVRSTYDAVIEDIGPMPNRKTFALHVMEHHKDVAAYLFTLYDGKSISSQIWKAIKPEVSRAFLAITEDNS